MLCIHNTQTDPYFNLAAEEYLLKNFKENIFMLWQNEPSIVIGKHQDVWAEVNLKFVQDQHRDRPDYADRQIYHPDHEFSQDIGSTCRGG